MVDEPLAPYITRSSATISLIMQDKHASLLKEEGFQHAILVLRNDGKWQFIFMFPQMILAWEVLTHWGWDKMAAILQTTYSKPFSSMKMVVFWSKFVP